MNEKETPFAALVSLWDEPDEEQDCGATNAGNNNVAVAVQYEWA